MIDTSTSRLADLVHSTANPITGSANDYDSLLDLIGDARFVLMGEASHGTHEFYQTRAHLTQRLIAEKGFTGVAVEADWPDAYRVNCYVRGGGDAANGADALGGFTRFPTWMWRNTAVLDFIGWLRAHNNSLPPTTTKVGFYGLDLYSLQTSIAEVLDYLAKVDPQAAQRARERYACFEHFGNDPQLYGYATSTNDGDTCEEEAVKQLADLQRHAAQVAQLDGRSAADEAFYAEQNARLVQNAEAYYRSMYRGRVSSWNLRDTHMAETLAELVDHLDQQGQRSKIVLWAHNSHLGDARATEMGDHGELNVGQLVRERYGNEAFLLGFSTYTGTVTAANDWGDAPERKRVRPGLNNSYEALFHAVSERGFAQERAVGASEPPTATRDFFVDLRHSAIADALREPRLERAIGVIYRPQTERMSHYFSARLADQFDALIHFDETRAVEPLDRNPTWDAGEPEERSWLKW